MRPVYFEVVGSCNDGDPLVVDGQLPNMRCSEPMKMPVLPTPAEVVKTVDSLPPVPKLKQGERAILSVEYGKEMDWRVRQTGASKKEVLGISFVSFFVMFIVAWRIRLWLKKKFPAVNEYLFPDGE